MGDTTSGSQIHMVWSRDILDEFKVSFLETCAVAFVADSSLITIENVMAMDDKNIRFISLYYAEFASKTYHFIVVRSSKLDNRKEKELEKLLETEHKVKCPPLSRHKFNIYPNTSSLNDLSFPLFYS